MNHVALRLVRALVLVLYLLALGLLAACAGTPIPPESDVTAGPSPLASAVEFNATPIRVTLPSVAPTVTLLASPRVTVTPPNQATPLAQPISPAQPLRAWALAPNHEAVFVLDASQRLFRLTPRSLSVERVSPPLFEAIGDVPAYLVDAGTYLVVGNESANRTLVLDRQDFRLVATWDRAGPLAADPNRHVFMAWERALWAYEMDNLAGPPTVVTEAPQLGLGALPVGLAADPATRQLYVTFHDLNASVPHQRERFQIYNLDAPAQTRLLDAQLGTLARPAFASKAGRTVSVLNAKSGFPGSRLLIYDGLNSQAGTSPAPLDGTAVIDAEGKRIYLLRERGLWVLDGTSLALVAVLPFTGAPPRDLVLSPDGATLYLFGDGWLAAKPTQELEDLGIPAVPGPFPRAWTYPERGDYFRARLYRSPTWETDGTAFVLLSAYGEMYRTTDYGRTWQLLAALSYPNLRDIQYLSLSPDFAADRTLIAHPAMLRSTDGGDTWQPFEPRIAFVSERDGNREIYTASQDGSDVCRLTANPAADENPAWSPAWTYIAFQSNRTGVWRIYTMRADCDPANPASAVPGALFRSANENGDDLLPAWSPDGRLITFVSTRDGYPAIYAAACGSGSSGSDQARQSALPLTRDPAGAWRPAWEPDSAHLVFTSSRRGSNGIYRLAWPGWGTSPDFVPPVTAVITDANDNRDPAVNRQGVVAFISDRDGTRRVYTLDTRYPGAQPHPLSEDRQPEGHPTWIEGATLECLVTLESHGVTGIYRASYAGGHTPVVVSAAFNGHPAWGPPLWKPDSQASYLELSVMP